jgi:hypothetical protein
MSDDDGLRRSIREAFDVSSEAWATMMALAEAEARVRERDRRNEMARVDAVAAALPDLLRAEGHDVPDGLTFRWVTE